MRLVEIAGHLIDPGKVSYVGPLDAWLEEGRLRYFTVVVDGAMIDWNFGAEPHAKAAHQGLLAAIESAQPECWVSWPKHGLNEKGEHLWGDCWPEHGKDEIGPFPSDPPFSDYEPDMPKHDAPSDVLLGIECGPEVRGTFRDGKFVKAMEVEDEGVPAQEWPNISCADRCIISTCRDDPGCPKGTKICPDLELPSSRGFAGGKG